MAFQQNNRNSGQRYNQGGNYRLGGNPPEIERINKEFKTLSEEDYLVPEGISYKLAKHFGGSVKINQIRNIFDSFLNVKQILAEGNNAGAKLALYDIYPKVAYAKGRDLVKSDFVDFVNALLSNSLTKEKNVDKDAFNKAFKIYEAMIAYTKFLGVDKK